MSPGRRHFSGRPLLESRAPRAPVSFWISARRSGRIAIHEPIRSVVPLRSRRSLCRGAALPARFGARPRAADARARGDGRDRARRQLPRGRQAALPARHDPLPPAVALRMRARRRLRARERLDLRDDPRPRLPAAPRLRHRRRRGLHDLAGGVPPREGILVGPPEKRLVPRLALLEERPPGDRRLHLRALVARRNEVQGGARALARRDSRGRCRPFHALQPRHARGARPLRPHVARRRRGAQGERREALRLRALQRAHLRRPLARGARRVREASVPAVLRSLPAARRRARGGRPRHDGPPLGLFLRLLRGRRRVQEAERVRRPRRRMAQVPRGVLRLGHPPRSRDDPRSRPRRPRLLPAARHRVRIRERPERESPLRRRDVAHRRQRPLRHDAAARRRARQADHRRRNLPRPHPREPPREDRHAVVARLQRELLLQVGATSGTRRSAERTAQPSSPRPSRGLRSTPSARRPRRSRA